MTIRNALSPTASTSRLYQRGFSLLEMTLALAVSGVLFGGIWQMMGISITQQDARGAATQAAAVAVAAQNYINDNTTALTTLLASSGTVMCIKITGGGAGTDAWSNSCATVSSPTSLAAGGYLPANFLTTNKNAYGQNYAFYVKREDVGTSVRLIGLVLTTGGAEIDDTAGNRIASMVGAAGGFIYDADDADDKGTSPGAANATAARGVNGGWAIDLTGTGWTTVGSTGQQGHIAILTNLIPSNAGSSVLSSSGSGATDIDGLSDGLANYTSYNLMAGDSGGASLSTGQRNTGVGYRALMSVSSGSDNTAFGAYALTSNQDGSRNVAMGPYALQDNLSGNNNIGIGYLALGDNQSGSDNIAIGDQASRLGTAANRTIAIGTQALYNNTGDDNIAIGYNALLANTSGTNNIGIGSYVLLANQTGGYNVAIGKYALSTITSVSGNVAIGEDALRYNNDTGVRNTGAGYGALRYNTSGTDNTALGYLTLMTVTNPSTGSRNTAAGSQAMDANTSGNDNTAAGFNALGGNQTGHRNTAAGYNALLVMNGGDDNTAIGDQAADAITSGSRNTAVGSSALGAAAGSDNTAFGYNALLTATGSCNTAVGGRALNKLTSGNDNTAVGFGALGAAGSFSNNTAVGYAAATATTGSYNSVMGHQALTGNTTGSYNTAFGKSALGSATYSLSYNTAAGWTALSLLNTGTANVAVGTLAGVSQQNLNNTVSIGYSAADTATSTALSDNVAIGADALGQNTGGSGNVVLGFQAGYVIAASGSNNTAIGFGAGPSASGLSNTTAIGYNTTVATSNYIRIGTGATTIGGYAAFSPISDRRQKTDIEPSDLGLDFVLQLRPVQYRMREGNGRLDYGFIAQDIQRILGARETNIITRDEDDIRTWRMTSSQLMGPIVASLQEQQRQRLDLDEDITALADQITGLQARLDQARLTLASLPEADRATLTALRRENGELRSLLETQGSRLRHLVRQREAQ